MFLCESIAQDEVINSFKLVKEKYEEFVDALDTFAGNCQDINSDISEEGPVDDVKVLQSSSNELYDFCTYAEDGLLKEINDVQEDLLNVYYPINFGDELPPDEAREVQQASREARENALNSF